MAPFNERCSIPGGSSAIDKRGQSGHTLPRMVIWRILVTGKDPPRVKDIHSDPDIRIYRPALTGGRRQILRPLIFSASNSLKYFNVLT